MYWPDLVKFLERIDAVITWCGKALAWLVSSQGIAVTCLVIGAIAVCIAYGPNAPGCGGPVSPVPTPVPPASPLETPPW